MKRRPELWLEDRVWRWARGLRRRRREWRRGARLGHAETVGGVSQVAHELDPELVDPTVKGLVVADDLGGGGAAAPTVGRRAATIACGGSSCWDDRRHTVGGWCLLMRPRLEVVRRWRGERLRSRICHRRHALLLCSCSGGDRFHGPGLESARGERGASRRRGFEATGVGSQSRFVTGAAAHKGVVLQGQSRTSPCKTRAPETYALWPASLSLQPPTSGPR
ncbi:hypothetical protein GUJ93_ZPchr0010g11219 [Zizania palustris]|uniref:Uncharacterized protein n=1 Tax=Zizania palustris TaxID=103762 RepID=A0A8J5WDX0_ZIZPA|nr:hypothetical protein GUJ93_ZPchr0010g11219 [Zizania palustris]